MTISFIVGILFVWGLIFAYMVKADEFESYPVQDEEVVKVGEAGSAEIYTFKNHGRRCWVVITDGQMADTAAIECD